MATSRDDSRRSSREWMSEISEPEITESKLQIRFPSG